MEQLPRRRRSHKMPLLLALFGGIAGIAFCEWAKTRFELTDEASKTPIKVVARALVTYFNRVSLWTVIVYLPLVLLTSGSLISGDALGWLQEAAIALKAAVDQWSQTLSDFALGWLVAAGCWSFFSTRRAKRLTKSSVGMTATDAFLSRSAFDTINIAGSCLSAASLALFLMTFLDMPDDSIDRTSVSPQAIPAKAIRVNIIDHEIARVMAVQVVRTIALTHRVHYPLTETFDAIDGNRWDPNSHALTDRLGQSLQNFARANPNRVGAIRARWEKYCSGFSSHLAGDVYSDDAIDRAVDLVFSLAEIPQGQLPKVYKDAISGATSALLKLERDDVELTFYDIEQAKDSQDLDRRLRLDANKLAERVQLDGKPLLALLQDRKFDAFVANLIREYDIKAQVEARDYARDEERPIDALP
jgi:hypothetical protein